MGSLDTPIQECLDQPPVQALVHFIAQHGYQVEDVTAWSLILPFDNDVEFTVRFTNNTGFRGTIRQRADVWQVHTYALTITIVGERAVRHDVLCGRMGEVMTLEEEIIACLEVCGLLPDSRTEGTVQALVALIRQREKQWVEEVGRLKVDRHFAYLAQEAAHEEAVQERGELQDQIEALQKQVWELESRLASYVPETERNKEEVHDE